LRVSGKSRDLLTHAEVDAVFFDEVGVEGFYAETTPFHEPEDVLFGEDHHEAGESIEEGCAEPQIK